MSFQKMKLVEEGELLRLKDKQIRDYNPQIRSMSFYQNEIDDILNDTKLTPEQKFALMGVAEKRFTGINGTLGTVVTPQGPIVLGGISSAVVTKEPTAEKSAATPPIAPVTSTTAPKADNPASRRILHG